MITPATYIQGTTVLGHFSVAQLSGAIAATPTAADPHASFRWAPSNSNALAVLVRLKLGWACITAITVAVRMAWAATIARGWTVDFSSTGTAANLSAKPKTGSMRSGTMQPSLLGTTGPQITTTGALANQTYTLDANAFAMTQFGGLVSGTGTGTAVAVQPGTAGPMQTIYEWTGLGQHPVVLSNLEGVVVTIVNTGWASGTVSLMAQWEWAEVLSF